LSLTSAPLIDAPLMRTATVARVLDRLKCDPDVYFLSAEAHNRWRGATPYDDFPMRRCVSIQLFAPALAKPDQNQLR
jgi:hypothetical protein